MGDRDSAPELTFRYTNWRGETAMRTVTNAALRFGSSPFHPGPDQWFINAKDAAKGEFRDFALNDAVFGSAVPMSALAQANAAADLHAAALARVREALKPFAKAADARKADTFGNQIGFRKSLLLEARAALAELDKLEGR